MTVIDTTIALTTAQIAGLKAAGVTGVSRYIAPVGQEWKKVTPAEYQRILAGGLAVSLNWEGAAEDLRDSSYDWVGAARSAQAQADACGYRGVIYYSADWDVTAAQWPTIRANLLRGPVAVHGLARVGLYGPSDALGWAQRDHAAAYFWQCMSAGFSGGRNGHTWPGAHLRQHLPTVIAGVSCDPNDLLIPAYGQATAARPLAPLAPPTQQEDTLFISSANADGTGQLYLCDGEVSRPITPDTANTILYLGGSPYGPTFTLVRGNSANVAGHPHEWSDFTYVPNGDIAHKSVYPNAVRGNWDPAWAGPLAASPVAGTGLSDTDRAALAGTEAAVAHLAAQLAAGGAALAGS